MGFLAPFVVIGHRGAAGLEPENTLRSFRRAFELGVDAIELDVYCVRGELIVIHDETLERTTSGKGTIHVPLSELRALDAGKGERIPLLDEVLDATPAGVGVNVELKGPDTAEPLVELLRRRRTPEVLVSSFRHDELTHFRAAGGTALLAPLFSRAREDMIAIARTLEAWSINIANGLATRERLDEIGRDGFRVLVYTVNDPSRARSLARVGATGIFTDRPDLMSGLRSPD